MDNIRYPSYQPGIGQPCWLTQRTTMGDNRYPSYQPGNLTSVVIAKPVRRLVVAIRVSY